MIYDVQLLRPMYPFTTVIILLDQADFDDFYFVLYKCGLLFLDHIARPIVSCAFP